MKKEDYKYKISSGSESLIMHVIMLLIFGGVSIWLHKENNGAYIVTTLFSIFLLGTLIYSIYVILFVKVLIGEKSLCHQTAPGNRKEYKYSEISKAWVSSGKATNGTNTYYFNYKTRDGEIHKFLFYSYQYAEIDYLISRTSSIEEADNE